MFGDVFRGRRVLVTGHTGFKGSWLCLWLNQLGAKVAGYSLGIPTSPSHFELLKLEKSLSAHYQGDIRDFGALSKAINEFKPEIIFHLAAEAMVRTCYEGPKRAFDTNMGGTLNVLEAIRLSESVKAAVIITSDKCYENVEWEYGYRETDRLGGKDPYSASKACAELAFYAYFHSYFKTQDRVRLATGRAGNVIGGGDWAKDRIVPDCIRAWTEGRSLLIRSPSATRPWQHVLEPLSGYLWLGAKLFQKEPGVHGESFNFGPNTLTEYSVLALIQEMQLHWPTSEFDVAVEGPTGKHEASFLKLSCDKAQARLGWNAILDFGMAAQFTADWYKNAHRTRAATLNISTNQISLYESLAQSKGLQWAKGILRKVQTKDECIEEEKLAKVGIR